MKPSFGKSMPGKGDKMGKVKANPFTKKGAMKKKGGKKDSALDNFLKG
jgi:hypothetical protein